DSHLDLRTANPHERGSGYPEKGESKNMPCAASLIRAPLSLRESAVYRLRHASALPATRINMRLYIKDPKHLVTSHLQAEHDGVKRELRRDVTSLIADLGSALQCLDAGERINPLSLQHASAISEMIGRWNTYLEMTQMLASIRAVDEH